MVYNLDRGDHPKKAGDRAYGHGDQITLEFVEGPKSIDYDQSIEKGLFVNIDGDGGVYRPTTPDNTDDPLEYEAVVKHSAEAGDDVTVHLRGAVRVAEDATDSDWPVVDTYEGDDELVVLR